MNITSLYSSLQHKLRSPIHVQKNYLQNNIKIFSLAFESGAPSGYAVVHMIE